MIAFLMITKQRAKISSLNFLWYISVNIWITASIKSSKCRKCLWLSFWYILLPVKKFVASSKRRPFWKCLNIKHSFNLTSDMKRSSQIMQKKKYFHDDDVIDDVTRWPQSRPSICLYIRTNKCFMITKQRAKISSNFVCICIMRL